jgi:hypothetical protein
MQGWSRIISSYIITNEVDLVDNLKNLTLDLIIQYQEAIEENKILRKYQNIIILQLEY